MERFEAGHRQRWLALAALVLVVLAIVLPSPRAVAQDEDQGRDQDASEFGLSAARGLGDVVVPGAWSPVVVTISPTVPLAGRLGVATETDGGQTVGRRAVEVAAGATERVWFLVPPGASGVDVSLAADDRVARTTVASADGGAALVGVLEDPDFVDRVGAVTDPLTGEVWTTVVVDDQVLDLGPLALEGLGTLVTGARALEALTDDQRRNVAAAVAHQGLHLVVTDVVSDPGVGGAPALVTEPGALDPGPRARGLVVSGDEVVGTDEAGAGPTNGATVTSGRGRVTWLAAGVGDDAVRSPRMWGQLWTGTPVASRGPWERVPPVNAWTLQQRGLRLPSSWGMAGFVGVYLVAAALVSRIGLARLRRRELSWVVLGGLGLVLAGGAFVASSGNDVVGGRSIAGGTWVDGVGIEQVVVAGDLSGGDTTLPGPGWQVQSLTWPGAGAEAVASGVRLSSSGIDDIGQASVVAASRVSDVPAPVAVEAVRLADGVRVEVVNTGTVALHALRVSAGDLVAAAAEDRSLDPGETLVVEVQDPVRGRWVPEDLVAGLPDWENDREGASLAGSTNGLVDDAGALVWVRAVARDLFPRPDGIGQEDPQVVAVGVTPTLGDAGAPAPLARLVWRSPGQDGFDGGGSDDGETWVRMTPASAGAAATLSVDLPASDAQACDAWLVYGEDSPEGEERSLCDGERPACPPGADCFEENGDYVEICQPDGGCESWERQGQSASGYRVWDTVDGAYRSWDADVAADVAADPGRVVTPLGDVVVEICCGAASLDRVEATTGGGS